MWIKCTSFPFVICCEQHPMFSNHLVLIKFIFCSIRKNYLQWIQLSNERKTVIVCQTFNWQINRNSFSFNPKTNTLTSLCLSRVRIRINVVRSLEIAELVRCVWKRKTMRCNMFHRFMQIRVISSVVVALAQQTNSCTKWKTILNFWIYKMPFGLIALVIWWREMCECSCKFVQWHKNSKKKIKQNKLFRWRLRRQNMFERFVLRTHECVVRAKCKRGKRRAD